ncbi:MAG: aldose epimerase family protein [Candidatus Helarchaeota archaeon]
MIMKFSLKDKVLSLYTHIYNLGNKKMLMGFGIHPYFSAGLNSKQRNECILKIPASKYWKLKKCLPTGELKAVFGKYSLKNGKKLKNLYFDDIFTNLIFNKKGWSECEFINPAQNFKILVQSDKNFKHIVIFAPKNHNFVCIEPYTCVTNAINIVKEQIIQFSPKNSINFEIKIKIEDI